MNRHTKRKRILAGVIALILVVVMVLPGVLSLML